MTLLQKRLHKNNEILNARMCKYFSLASNEGYPKHVLAIVSQEIPQEELSSKSLSALLLIFLPNKTGILSEAKKEKKKIFKLKTFVL